MTIYYHMHHITPKHMGGSNDADNLIKLTVEEHAEAHKRLFEEHGKKEDYIAWKALSGQINNQEAFRLKCSLGGKKNKNRKRPDLSERNKTPQQIKAASCKKPGTANAMAGNTNHKQNEKVVCGYCGSVGSYVIMMRWHHERCKHKK